MSPPEQHPVRHMRLLVRVPAPGIHLAGFGDDDGMEGAAGDSNNARQGTREGALAVVVVAKELELAVGA